MARKILTQKYFNGGISESEKEGMLGSFFFAQKLDITSDASSIKVLPATVKESGTVVTDLVKWIVSGAPYDENMYAYGDTGRIYKRDNAGTWTLLRTVANSLGQGMDVHDNYLYYTQNTQIGRYGPLNGVPAFTDNWQTGLNDTSDTKFAPIKVYQAGFAVGHANNVAWWDGTVWDLDTLALPPGLEVRSLEILDQMLFIGTWRGTAITQNEEGYVFFWDGTSSTFNDFVPIGEGGVNALLNSRNRLLSVIGSAGYLYLHYAPFQKVQPIPKLSIKKYLEVYPGAVTNWRGLSLIGVGSTDSTELVQGVYGWGGKSERYPDALNYMFSISTGTQTGTTLKIGALKGAGNNLFIGWRDGATYGIDKVTNSGDPYTSGVLETLITDDQQPGLDKQAGVIKATHKALLTGESIQVGYKKDRASSYTVETANSTVGSTETRLVVPPADARHREFQLEVILNCSATTSPEVTSIGFAYDDLRDERNY